MNFADNHCPASLPATDDAVSTYARLHREYWQNDSSQPGTRYAMLLAFLTHALHSSRRIIDDIRLVGPDKLKHQVQLQLRTGMEHRTVLIECKEFDLSNQQLGLGMVEEFARSVEASAPDEAIVISCLGFTPEAQKFAKQHGIKLADIREFQAADTFGKNTGATVHRLHDVHVTEPVISLQLRNADDIEKLHFDMKQAGMSGFGLWKGEPVYLNMPEGRVQFNDFVDLKTSIYRSRTRGPVTLNIPFSDTTIEVNSAGPIPVQSLKLEFEVMRSIEYYETIANKIVQVVVEGFEERDMIVFNHSITRLSINAQTGDLMR